MKMNNAGKKIKPTKTAAMPMMGSGKKMPMMTPRGPFGKK